jgi:VIT1/CCC1 family predicted Fe2+/Mn2+ transporter
MRSVKRTTITEHRAAHEPDQIRRRLTAPPDHSYLRDLIYGAIDGTVTTFAVVSGVAGAGLSSEIVILLGLANLLGDGFSMAASNYLGTRADEQLLERARREEESHIELYPEGEREEIRQIFASKGFDGKDLERVVEVISADRQRWVDTMITDELRMPLHRPNAFTAALATFFAFVLVGILPLVPFFVNLFLGQASTRIFLYSSLVTGATFFLVGAAKSRFVHQHWYRSGLETLAIGASAASLAYLVGWLLKGLIR